MIKIETSAENLKGVQSICLNVRAVGFRGSSNPRRHKSQNDFMRIARFGEQLNFPLNPLRNFSFFFPSSAEVSVKTQNFPPIEIHLLSMFWMTLEITLDWLEKCKTSRPGKYRAKQKVFFLNFTKWAPKDEQWNFPHQIYFGKFAWIKLLHLGALHENNYCANVTQ